MDSLKQKLNNLFRRTSGKTSDEEKRARDAGEALRILENAIEYLQQFGCGKDLEYQRARIILQGRIDAVWADFGYPKQGTVSRVA